MLKKIVVLFCLASLSVHARPFPGEEQLGSSWGELVVGTTLWLESVQILPDISPSLARTNLQNRFNHLYKGRHCASFAYTPGRPGPIYVAYQKSGQTRPTIYAAQAGDQSFWSDAFRVLVEDRRGAFIAKLRRHNFPSDHLEVWTLSFPSNRLNSADISYATGTLARLAHWGQPIRAVVVHVYTGEPGHLQHDSSISLSPTGNLKNDLLTAPTTTDGVWRVGKAAAQPWP